MKGINSYITINISIDEKHEHEQCHINILTTSSTKKLLDKNEYNLQPRDVLGIKTSIESISDININNIMILTLLSSDNFDFTKETKTNHTIIENVINLY